MRILVPAICSAVGTTVGVATYVTISEAGNATATVAGTGTTLLSLLLGKGAEWMAGPGTGHAVQIITHEAGHSYFVPLLRRSSHWTAAGVAAVTGGAATLLSAALWHGGRFVVNYLSTKQTTPTPLQFEVTETDAAKGEEFVLVDVQPSPNKTVNAIGWVYNALEPTPSTKAEST
jgi:hypothetical protein